MDLALRVVEVTQMQEGVLIVYADGEIAIYPISLLREMLPRADGSSFAKTTVWIKVSTPS